jgi:hypothetical protein
MNTNINPYPSNISYNEIKTNNEQNTNEEVIELVYNKKRKREIMSINEMSISKKTRYE